MSKSSSKTELYESLYSLNAGLDEMRRALLRMRDAGLLVPFVNGHILILEELRNWVHMGVMGIMSESERSEWEVYESARRVAERALRLFGEDPGKVM